GLDGEELAAQLTADRREADAAVEEFSRQLHAATSQRRCGSGPQPTRVARRLQLRVGVPELEGFAVAPGRVVAREEQAGNGGLTGTSASILLRQLAHLVKLPG